MAVALERSETVGENDEDRHERKDVERQKRREKRERSRNRNKEQTQLEPASEILNEEIPAASIENTPVEASTEVKEEEQRPQTEEAPPAPVPRTVINVTSSGETEIPPQLETQDHQEAQEGFEKDYPDYF